MSAGNISNIAEERGIKKQVSLPLSKAIEFAWKSVRIRFMRSLITAGGIFLGIAFLASILLDKAVKGANIEPTEAARLNWLVALSLAVCVVGITNSMLMSVTERFREIGTMKCLGALSQFIVKIFMIEAIAMGAIASSLGWAVGTLLMVLTKIAIGVPKTAPEGTTWYGSLGIGDLFGLPLGSFWVCVVIGIVLTAVATYIPARQAADIPPAAALRTDV
jgi:predicted lysophospholipase L1 biosynthesis ABC-type transport system permease subunit